MYCTVLTSSRSKGISSGLTYKTIDGIGIGMCVRVPLRNQLVEGIVLQVYKHKPEGMGDVRAVHSLISKEAFLTQEQVELLQWIAEYYFCSLRQVLRVLLPAPPWNQLLPKPVTKYFLCNDDVPLRGAKQQAVVSYLQNKEWVTKQALAEETGASTTVLRRLQELGVIEEKQEESQMSTDEDVPIIRPVLTEKQQAVYQAIHSDTRPTLLFGVTGSGKTEVYAQLIADTIESGKQALLLVPEILLTEHCIHRFEELLDGKEAIAVLHSRLTPAQRRRQWQRIQSGMIKLVIGSRSALFAPLQKLGLIIMDEEHEWTYKNEQTPRYHARTVAEQYCQLTGARLVLGSATPSLESWYKAKQRKYLLTSLPQRYKQQPMPEVQVVDLAAVAFGKHYPFSPTLLSAIEQQLQSGHQSVLFLNRRGVATAVLCLECRRRIVSPDSQLPFTVHHRSDGTPFLMDHTTGVVAPLPAECPHCGSANLQTIGAGTQRIEQILESVFPQARILRMDKDTIRHPEQMRLLLKKMREGQADILLGTQSVVKGLDLPNVTLAAVLLADVGLSIPDFRAGERVFQLLTQLTGRSGRAKPGSVIIQTFRPESLEVLHAANHSTEVYLEQELALRLHTKYPPLSHIIRCIIRGYNSKQRVEQFYKSVVQAADDTHQVSLAPTLFGGGKEWHILIRGSSPEHIIAKLDRTDVIVDRDPVECV